ncbi:MAG: arylesterase [Porticoccaceae bacterium]|nr:arylesterase [Porticoccaceae bacterium]
MRISKLLVLLILLSGNSFASSTLLVLGDSISAGYGINPDKGWVNLLRTDLEPQHRVINASISGDTTGNGLARLPKLLKEFKPDYVLLELGGNDGLRGHPLSKVKSNLQTMIDLVREQDAQPILFAMRLPPNYGKRYADSFAQLFIKLAQQEDLPLLPIPFEELVSMEGMIQRDGIHPTEPAQPIIKQTVLTELVKILK